MVRVGLERSPFRNLVPASEGCVSSYCPVASAVGMRVLQDGGNAVDAAATTALALAATYPQAGNLGGGGFMLIRTAGGDGHLLDYRECAPRAVDAAQFAGAKAPWDHGGRAVGVPGTIAGLAAAVERFGTWSWDRLLAPAIELAEHGTWVTDRQARYFAIYAQDLKRYEETVRALLPPSGVWRPGDLFRNPDLGRTLRTLAEHGPQAFHDSWIGEAVTRTVRAHGGALELEDLAAYRPVWRPPYQRSVFGHDVLTTPLPSGGGFVVLLSLALLEATGVAALPVRSPERYRQLARVFRIAFALRGEFAGDPTVVPREVLERHEHLLHARFGPAALDELERELGLHDQPPFTHRPPPRDTTNLCVIDGAGMAVANTYSLNTLFGAKLVADGTGMLLNNTLDDFCILPDVPNYYFLFEGKHNRLTPGVRPLGNMAPTIVARGGHVELAIGGSGGPRIPTAIVQTILGMYGNGLALPQAAALPRVHHQCFPTQLDVEDSLSATDNEALERDGFDVVQFPRLGILSAVHCDVQARTLLALLDTRF